MSRIAVVTSAFLVALVLVGPVGRLAAQDSLPTDRVAEGRALFQGAGDCAGCHGADGTGTSEGPSLTSGPWSLGDGTLAWLTHMARHGGWGVRGRDGEPQRMRGPTVLDSAQVARVADYVFSISRSKTRGQ